MEEDIITNAASSDDDRMDFIDAENEEITDKVTKEFQKKKRPLRASEIDRVSHGLVDNLKDSMLSQVMDPTDYQIMHESQGGYSYQF